MALQITKSHSEIPEGVVTLNREEALDHQKTVVRDWPNEIDVAFLRYGYQISAAASVITSFSISNYFRKYLRVSPISWSYMFIPNVLIPSFVSCVGTDKIVTDNILLMRNDCPLCQQAKFAALQGYVGLVFPLTFGFTSFASIAIIGRTYPLPSLKTHAREFWQVSFKIYKQGAPRFYIAGMIQTAVVLFLPYLQTKNLLTITTKIREKMREVS